MITATSETAKTDEEAAQGETAVTQETSTATTTEGEAATTTDPEAPAKPVHFVQVTYDDNDVRVEKDVEEDAATKSDSAVLKTNGRKMVVKFDVKYKETTVYLEDPALQALINVATRHLRPTTEDVLEYLGSPFCDFLYCWDQLSDIASLNADSAIVRELHDKISKTTETDHPFGNYLKNLYLLKDEDRLQETVACVKKLLSVVKEAPVMQPYFRGEDSPFGGSRKVAWPWLWSVFVPGDLVVYRNPEDQTQDQVMLVRWENQTECILDIDDTSIYNVKCWAYDWDPIDHVFKLVAIDVPIGYFHSTKSITSLCIFPLSYLDPQEREERIKTLTARGRIFHDICTKPERFNYTGPILPSPRVYHVSLMELLASFMLSFL